MVRMKYQDGSDIFQNGSDTIRYPTAILSLDDKQVRPSKSAIAYKSLVFTLYVSLKIISLYFIVPFIKELTSAKIMGFC